MGQCTHETQSG